MLIVAGISGVSHGTGYIVGQHTMALDVIMPKDNAAFKVGERRSRHRQVQRFLRREGYREEQATGAEEELKAPSMKSEGTTPSAPRIWKSSGRRRAKKPGIVPVHR